MNKAVPPRHSASRRTCGGPLLDGSLLESQPQTGTAHVPAPVVDRNCPQTNVSRITGKVIESPDRVGQGIKTSTVPVRPLPGGHDGLLLGGSLLDGGGSLEGGSLDDGGGSLLEGGGSLDDGGSLLDGGSLEDGSLDDDDGSLLEGGSLLEDGSLDDDDSLLGEDSLEEDEDDEDDEEEEDDDELELDEEQRHDSFHCSSSHLQLSAQYLAIPQLPPGMTSAVRGKSLGEQTMKVKPTVRHFSFRGSYRTSCAAASRQGSRGPSNLNRQWSS